MQIKMCCDQNSPLISAKHYFKILSLTLISRYSDQHHLHTYYQLLMLLVYVTEKFN